MATLKDRKSWFSVMALTLINNIVLGSKFRQIEICGEENLPKDKPFILISNHSSRWDSLVVQKLLSRRANYMTSPTELVGLQGALLPGIGSFPARASRDVLTFITNQMLKNEVLVIFPEGNVFYDGQTHPLKPGAARIALTLNAQNISVPIVPIAIQYKMSADSKVLISVGQPIDVSERIEGFLSDSSRATKSLTASLHREICFLKMGLGNFCDSQTIYNKNMARDWAQLV